MTNTLVDFSTGTAMLGVFPGGDTPGIQFLRGTMAWFYPNWIARGTVVHCGCCGSIQQLRNESFPLSEIALRRISSADAV